MNLVVNDGNPPALEVGQSVPHGLKLFRWMTRPVGDLANYSHRLPGAVGAGRISGMLFVRHVRVILHGAFRLHVAASNVCVTYTCFKGWLAP